MKKMMKLFAVVFTTITLAACVQVPVENNSRANQLAVSSVRDMPMTYPKGSLFSMSPKYVKETSLKASQTQAVYQLYTNAIVGDLQEHGFMDTQSPSKAAFHVDFGIALTQDFSDDTIDKKFGISPGLPEQEDLKKGSFLISIEDVKSGERVWRGIAQGFAHEELTEEERVQRTKQIVTTVMKQFYQPH